MTTLQISELKSQLAEFLPSSVQASTTVNKYLGAFRQIEAVIERFDLDQLENPDGRKAVLEMIDADPVLSKNAYHQDGTYSAVLGKVQLMLSSTESVPKEIVPSLILKTHLASSLLSKPFLILTGNSGTGKTRSAEDFVMRFRDVEDAKNAKNVALVAVGADWTDNRNVVGYVNHLRPITVASDDERPIYQSTPILDLLLEASSSERELVPHFLILDEMNLSHVERYFADFLSAMEARYGAIRLHDEGPRGKADFRLPRFEGDAVGVPRELPYPKNLFVIGTVNVDETTYMFSPKVLDRAHVIEFEVDPAEVAAFLDEPKPLEPVPRAPMGEAEAFLQFSLRARGMKEPGLDALPMAVKRKVNGALIDLLEILQKGRFEFAFRTAKEVAAYMRVCRELRSKDGWDEEAWQADLDDEILQKVLPRLHGSRSRVGPLLGALGWYLHSRDKAGAMEFFPPLGDELPKKSVQEIIPLKDADFPRSFGKIQRMARVVVEEQFVSFIC